MTPGCAAMARALSMSLERSDADGAAGAMDHFDASGKHLVDAVLDDGVRLAAADFHDLPRAGGDRVNFARHALRNFAIAELGEVLHLPPLLLSS